MTCEDFQSFEKTLAPERKDTWRAQLKEQRRSSRMENGGGGSVPVLPPVAAVVRGSRDSSAAVSPAGA